MTFKFKPASAEEIARRVREVAEQKPAEQPKEPAPAARKKAK
jgi:hypothetical protein